MKSNVKVARRTFLRNTLVASSAIPLTGIPIILKANNEKADESDPISVALLDVRCRFDLVYQGDGEVSLGYPAPAARAFKQLVATNPENIGTLAVGEVLCGCGIAPIYIGNRSQVFQC
jgi:hypothetical protein